MPTRNVGREEQAKLRWLRAAAKEGFDAIDCGDYVSLHSGKEIHKKVSAELAAERGRR